MRTIMKINSLKPGFGRILCLSIMAMLMMNQVAFSQNDDCDCKVTFDHMIEKLDPLMYEVVEPIDPQVFEMTNEYWVSYYIGKEILDKKFTFVEGSIREENMILIETLNKKGVLHI